ncbi:unnamed protein product, partial [marine sediment metagenome]
APSVYTYDTPDTLLQVTSIGYFIDKSGQLEEDDIINAVTGDGFVILGVTSDTSTVSLLVSDTSDLLTIDDLPTTAFGELLVAEPTPVSQILSINGMSGKVITLQSGTGVAAVVDGEFNCTTGGGLGAYATIATNRTLPYRPGEGGECKLTARFDAGVTGTAQLAGLLSLTDSLSFAMFGSIFGVLRLHHGELETQELQITTAATGAGNVTVTVDGTAYVVPVTNDTAQVNAKEITTSLTAQVANYLFSADDDTVLAIATVAIEATLPFGFSAGAVPS